MSSRVLAHDSPVVGPVDWPRHGVASEQPPSHSEERSGSEPAPADQITTGRLEFERLVAIATSAEASLAAAARDAEERTRRALEQGLQDGYRKGYQEGSRAAEESALQQLDSVRDAAARTAAETAAQMVDMRRRMRSQMEADLVRLALAIARRLLRRELTVDPDALAGIVRVAVERVSPRELHRVVVAPADVASVTRHLISMHLGERVEVAGDASLELGAVILETTRGDIDASIETQLAEIDRGLADVIRREA